MRKIASAVLVLGVLTACGAGSGGRADTVDAQPNDAGAVKAAPAKPAFTLSGAQIRSRLLRLADMPTGYTVDKSKDDSNDTPSGCKELDALDGYDKQTAAAGEVKFTGGTFGPFVTEAVSVPRTSAKTIYRKFVHAMRDCPSFRTKNDDGSYATATINGLSFPKFADETFAAQMRLSPVEMVGSIYLDLVVVRIGNVFMLLSDAQVSAAPDGTVVEGLTRTAVTRLEGS